MIPDLKVVAYSGTHTMPHLVLIMLYVSLGLLVPSQNTHYVKINDIYFFIYSTIIDLQGRLPGYYDK